jgi:hypothetical protein
MMPSPVALTTVQINSFAFSGGQETAEKQRLLGANLEVDVPYHYLQFFLEDDDELRRVSVLVSLAPFCALVCLFV